jgi:hypothetical protein
MAKASSKMARNTDEVCMNDTKASGRVRVDASPLLLVNNTDDQID